MIITLAIFGFIAATLIVGKINLSIQFNKTARELFSGSRNISDKAFNYEQLSGLPEPVQRYFKHVLKEGKSYISYVRLTHAGQFKTGLDKGWVNIRGEQYFTTENPGFIWKGVTLMFTARDMFVADKGRLIVSLFSLFNVVNGQGENYDQGELLRWLGESVWFPTNLLPSERLQWTPIDEKNAKLTFSYKGMSLFYIVTFNDAGEITQLESERYMEENILKPWIIKLSDYKMMNGIIVPATGEVIWRLEKGDFSYAKFDVKEIEYDKSEKY